MPIQGRRDHLRVVALFLAVSAFGLGVRFALVHVPPGFEAPGMCEHVVDFWNGDQFPC